MAKEAGGITIEALAALTKFSVAELKNLALRSYFPTAKRGLYQVTPAVSGCFRARAEQAEKAGELPVYDSMQQCASRTGLPLSLLKLAKRSGCEGFRWNRVALGPVLTWLFSRDPADNTDWKKDFEKSRACLARIA